MAYFGRGILTSVLSVNHSGVYDSNNELVPVTLTTLDYSCTGKLCVHVMLVYALKVPECQDFVMVISPVLLSSKVSKCIKGLAFMLGK